MHDVFRTTCLALSKRELGPAVQLIHTDHVINKEGLRPDVWFALKMHDG